MTLLRFIGAAGLVSAVSTGILLLYFTVLPLRQAISTPAVSRGVSQFLRDPLGWYMGPFGISFSHHPARR
jgi:hypothetical protein